jgi:exodeoxyribonuclease VII large subunit
MGDQQSRFDFTEEDFGASSSAKVEVSSEVVVETKSEPTVYTVSDINSLIREILEGEFSEIWLRGEISNFKPHTSGHFYFSLKDDQSQVSAVMFRGHNSKLKFRPENGLEVLVRGKVTVYEPRGNYQIFCEYMEPVGAGALQKAFEQLKAKLQAEGLFAAERKRAIPAFPKHIGIVTSPTGAAIKDILNVLRRRYKSARITLAPAVVQGDAGVESIVSAIALVNKLKDVDVLIVGRGGGSIEDLWCFNDERVARAIVGSRIPVISAVGHEVDFTIADFVADLRAPTPSAAAELVVRNIAEVIEKINSHKARLWQSYRRKMVEVTERFRSLCKRLVSPARRLEDLQMRNDEIVQRLENAMFRYIDDRRRHVHLTLQKLGTPRETIMQLLKRVELAALEMRSIWSKTFEAASSRIIKNMAKLDALSPLRVVERGYSIVESNKKIIKSAKDLSTGDLVNIRFAKGSVEARVEKITKDKN